MSATKRSAIANKAKLLDIRKLQYLIAGGSAFVLEYASFLLLYYVLSSSAAISNVVSFVVGLSVSFLLNKLWVFAETAQNRATHVQAVLYASLAGLNLLITTILIGILVDGIGIAAFVAKVLTIGLVAVWNYLLFSRLIFAGRKQ